MAPTSFLTDNANCGRCGKAPAATGCAAGTCRRPTNDVRTNALVIVPNPAREVTVSGNTTNATNDGPTVPCGCTTSGNVWYRFTLTAESPSTSTPRARFTTRRSTSPPWRASRCRARRRRATATSALQRRLALCGTGGGFTSGLQSRTAGLPAGTLRRGRRLRRRRLHARFQVVARTVGQTFVNARLTGTGNTGVQTLATTSVAAGVCGGSGGAENVGGS